MEQCPEILAPHTCVYSGDFLHFLCEAESGPVAALVELRLFLAGFSQPPCQLTSLHCGIFQRTSTAGLQ